MIMTMKKEGGGKSLTIPTSTANKKRSWHTRKKDNGTCKWTTHQRMKNKKTTLGANLIFVPKRKAIAQMKKDK